MYFAKPSAVMGTYQYVAYFNLILFIRKLIIVLLVLLVYLYWTDELTKCRAPWNLFMKIIIRYRDRTFCHGIKRLGLGQKGIAVRGVALCPNFLLRDRKTSISLFSYTLSNGHRLRDTGWMIWQCPAGSMEKSLRSAKNLDVLPLLLIDDRMVVRR